MFGKQRLLLSAKVFCLLSSVTSIAFGQAVSGTINGYVYDKSDAVIAEARVTITNTETGVAITRTTDSTGLYIATNLPPGTYSVSFEGSGFRRVVQENVVLR